jgi:hypothetical protein
MVNRRLQGEDGRRVCDGQGGFSAKSLKHFGADPV